MMNFTYRSSILELMDDPNLEADKYRQAYLDINRCNKWLGGNKITIKALKILLKSRAQKSYTILDMGCGDGEMLRQVAQAFKKKPVKLNLIGVDLKDDILDLAREKSVDYPAIQFKNQNILALTETSGCDVLLCTLTMHHFTDEQIKIFLTKFSKVARIGVVINDLQRSKLAYALFKLFSIFFIRSHTAKYDGLVSITKGFLKNELWAYAKNISTMQHSIQWKWAFRYVWVMQTKRPI
ncbi:methyltransferase domain-containing protein [uncultured Croceitalea sp.]|uniref:methyltransferase domain-containing protein n=1 Tax=uncultured Croceitalea sp. TaxID=1798908 RepID=UPI00330589C3